VLLAVAILLPLLTAVGVLEWVGWRLTFRMLRERTTVVPLAPSSWSPSVETNQMPNQLLGLRRRWFAGFDLRATGFEVVLATAADGRPAILWRLPRRWLSDLRQAVRASYPGVELRELREMPPGFLPGPGSGKRTRVLLRPTRASEWPLKELPEAWDAKAGLAVALGSMKLDKGERLEVHIGLLPVAPRQWLSIVRGMFRDAHRQTAGDPLTAVVNREDYVDPAERGFRFWERRSLTQKIGKSDPMFRLQVLAMVQVDDDVARRRVAHNVRAAFEPWSGANFFSSPILPRDLPGFRGLFDWTFSTGFNGSNKVVAANEVRHLVAPFYGTVDAVRLTPAEELPPPAEALEETQGRRLAVHLDRDVRQSVLQARHHTHVLGPTGVGKSYLLIVMGLDDFQGGRAVVPWVDPKDGQAIDDFLARIPRERWDDVHLVDPTRLDYAEGLNVMECPDPERRDVVIDGILQVFADLFPDVWGARQAVTMQRALMTLMHNAEPTLCDLVPLLTSPRGRRRLMAGLRAAARSDVIARELLAWWREYNVNEERIGPLLARLDDLLLRPRVRMILGQRRSTLDLAQVLDHGGVVLARLPTDLGPTSRLIGSFLFLQTWRTVQARQGRAPDSLPDASAYLDEGELFMHIRGAVEGTFDRARSLRWGITFAHQRLGQLSDELRGAIDANARTKVFFQLGEDAKRVAHRMGGVDLSALGDREVAIALPNSKVFVGRTPDLPPAIVDPAELATYALQRWGRSRREIEAEWSDAEPATDHSDDPLDEEDSH
jgi:hypothetical protein